MDNVLLSLLMTETNQFPPVGGPLKIALITVAFLTVRRQGDFFAVLAETKPDIVVLDEGLDLSSLLSFCAASVLFLGRLRELQFGSRPVSRAAKSLRPQVAGVARRAVSRPPVVEAGIPLKTDTFPAPGVSSVRD